MAKHCFKSLSELATTLPAANAEAVDRFLSRLTSLPPQAAASNEIDICGWRSPEMVRCALGVTASLARGCHPTSIEIDDADGAIRCLLQDQRMREFELLLSFESPHSSGVTRWCFRPLLADGVEVRTMRREDLDELMRLERAAPVQRDDGTKVVIEHDRCQFDREGIVRDHRWLAAFHGDRMLAIQGVAITNAIIGGSTYRIAYNHYSRSDPDSRNSGHHIYLVTTLYRDIFPVIDQFISLVDVQNATGLRLSFGTPWATRVRRIFLRVDTLAALQRTPVERVPFDPDHVATLLNRTHEGMNLWVPRTAAFLRERNDRAPEIYGPGCWRVTANAVLALWRADEKRTYSRDGTNTVRTLALVLDYGFTDNATGRAEMLELLCEAAAELVDSGISHLAIFVSDDHPRTEWLAKLGDAVDTYAVCAPVLASPDHPSGPVYCDHVIF
jgi:hypothetical protein